VVLTLEDEIDISRGDMIVKKENLPDKSTRFEAALCWMDDNHSLSLSNHYILQQTSRTVQAYVTSLDYRININTLDHETVDTLTLNEIGYVDIETAHPLYFDPYMRNRETGSFVLIDPATNLTVAAGMIRHEARDPEDAAANTDADSAARRPAGTPGQTTSPMSAGKAPPWICPVGKTERAPGRSPVVYRPFRQREEHPSPKHWKPGSSQKAGRFLCSMVTTSRHGLNGDLGFSEEDRIENIRRVSHVARLMYDAGFIVLCTFISPMKSMRDEARKLFPEGRFREVFVKVDIDEARRRDPKGLYKKADAGEISDFTGVHQPYQESPDAEIIIDTQKLGVDEAVEKLVESLG
jgi:bifunctional enzyme CysN/CysC